MKNIFGMLFLTIMMTVNAQEFSVMTYNIKLDYPVTGANSWTNRKPMLVGQLKFYEPDIFGVQEAMPNQMKDLDSLLIDYHFLGVGRDDGKKQGEFSAIFYKKDAFTVLESSTFWLSKTPDIVSMGWDAACNRICTYALFLDVKRNKKFWVFNTHFDHVGKVARKKSMTLILQKMNALNTENLPVILMGDFNMEASHKSIRKVTKYLHDTKVISKTPAFGPEGTFNGFLFDKPVTRRIDYIFVSDVLSVHKYAVLSDSKALKYPSDHLPVYVELEITIK